MDWLVSTSSATALSLTIIIVKVSPNKMPVNSPFEKMRAQPYAPFRYVLAQNATPRPRNLCAEVYEFCAGK